MGSHSIFPAEPWRLGHEGHPRRGIGPALRGLPVRQASERPERMRATYRQRLPANKCVAGGSGPRWTSLHAFLLVARLTQAPLWPPTSQQRKRCRGRRGRREATLPLWNSLLTPTVWFWSRTHEKSWRVSHLSIPTRSGVCPARYIPGGCRVPWQVKDEMPAVALCHAGLI